MNLLIIWLIISVISTGLVLLGIRFAPVWEGEPLDTPGERWFRIDVDHDQPTPSENPSRRQYAKADPNVKIIRSDARTETPPQQPTEKSKSNDKGDRRSPIIRLGRFAIVRSEEPQA